MKLLLVLGVLFSFNAFADFSGDWSGTGTFQDIRLGEGKHACPEVRWQVIQNGDSIVIGDGDANCPIPVGMSAHDFRIVNGELFFGEQRVGTITDTHIHIEFPQYYEPEHRLYSVAHFTLELTSNGMKLRNYEVLTGATEPFWELDATLFRND